MVRSALSRYRSSIYAERDAAESDPHGVKLLTSP